MGIVGVGSTSRGGGRGRDGVDGFASRDTEAVDRQAAGSESATSSATRRRGTGELYTVSTRAQELFNGAVGGAEDAISAARERIALATFTSPRKARSSAWAATTEESIVSSTVGWSLWR